MKTKFIIIGIIVLIILSYLYLTHCYNKLPELLNYRIYSNNGKVIPAKLYKRVTKTLINNKTEYVEEVIICFDDSLINNKLNRFGEDELFKFLVIVPKFKMIGFVENPGSFKIKDKYICQVDDKADMFTSIINNHTIFKNPPITQSTFSEKGVVFNSYGILKNFGSEIYVEYDLKSVLP
ncbi:hypothetical protein [Emticicia sp. TH156]|uniref:hypothetical protein n=1 Tax=Emticicia sp. TH156 TaxID=2067454 RepID=UPI000C782787|nr:hypothetical protein [Emticicia sp. TH156]PLK42152.1 hypothetical protein C0V77_22470 [Emticicia sp. TH156]